MSKVRTKRAAGLAASGAQGLILLLGVWAAGHVTAAEAANPPSVAFLGVQFQNDNEGLEPTTDAERARLARTEKEFVEQITASGRYRIIPVPEDLRGKIAAGQAVGECGGCEFDFGKQLGADIVAWMRVQKVSNLILNMNVYMEDVKTRKMLLVKSVDVRGNTDDSWSRSLAYLVKNSVLTADVKAGGN